MVNKWLNAINDGFMIGVVMIDFKKAFDLVVTTRFYYKNSNIISYLIKLCHGLTHIFYIENKQYVLTM